MHKVAMITIGISTLGLILSVILFGVSANQFVSSQENVDWNDWIVYEVEGSEAILYLDEDIGYTIYVDNSYSCEEIEAEVIFKENDYYYDNCDSFYDFDNWMQIGDIDNEYSGEHQVTVNAERFILVDWTTVDGNSLENTLIGGLGCCFSIGVLAVGLTLALILKNKKTPMTQQRMTIKTDVYESDIESNK